LVCDRQNNNGLLVERKSHLEKEKVKEMKEEGKKKAVSNLQKKQTRRTALPDSWAENVTYGGWREGKQADHKRKRSRGVGGRGEYLGSYH